MTCLNLLERSLNRLIARKVDLDRFNGVGSTGAFAVQSLDRCIGFIQGSTTHQDMIWLVGPKQRFDCLIADSTITAGHSYDLSQRHFDLSFSARAVLPHPSFIAKIIFSGSIQK